MFFGHGSETWLGLSLRFQAKVHRNAAGQDFLKVPMHTMKAPSTATSEMNGDSGPARFIWDESDQTWCSTTTRVPSMKVRWEGLGAKLHHLHENQVKTTHGMYIMLFELVMLVCF